MITRAVAAFVGNAISPARGSVCMSATAGRALGAGTARMLDAAGFDIRVAELSAIEAAGGSLRCCVGEVF